MKDLKPSTLEQRHKYYSCEFPKYNLRKWFSEGGIPQPQLYAVDMGSETGIIKNREKLGKMIILRAVNLEDKLKDYLPEDVYYDRNRYGDVELALEKLNFREIFTDPNIEAQELAFDIDPENIPCGCRSSYPHFCEKCLKESIQQGVRLAEHLSDRFDRIGLVYSGRGIHVHVFERSAFKLTIKEREEINNDVVGFGIDPWVSRGRIRLIRLPFSLNALVSRVVLPLTVEQAVEFDPVTSDMAVPGFLKKE